MQSLVPAGAHCSCSAMTCLSCYAPLLAVPVLSSLLVSPANLRHSHPSPPQLVAALAVDFPALLMLCRARLEHQDEFQPLCLFKD